MFARRRLFLRHVGLNRIIEDYTARYLRQACAVRQLNAMHFLKISWTELEQSPAPKISRPETMAPSGLFEWTDGESGFGHFPDFPPRC